MKNYQLLVDVWEAETNLDYSALKANDVSGVIIRLNDMNGGHHMDANFANQWKLAGYADMIRAPYFVYNPWVTGKENFSWLMAHLPADAGRVFVDIEVAYRGYSSTLYAANVLEFMHLLEAVRPATIYTGEWFLPYLSKWPEGASYWWAQYMTALYPASRVRVSWADVRGILATLPQLPTNGAKCPGTIKMWQISGDRLILPGSDKAIDVNTFTGTRDELAAWMGGRVVAIPPVPSSRSGLYVFSRAAYWQRPAGGPLVTPMYNMTKTSGKKEVLLNARWVNYLQKINNNLKAWGKIVAKDWGPSKGFNDKGLLILNTLIYPGRNIVHIPLLTIGADGERWGLVESLRSDALPGSDFNYIDMPHLVHRVYGSNSKWAWFNLENSPIVPLVSDDITYVRMEWLTSVDAMLPKTVQVNLGWGVNVRELPDVTSAKVGFKLPLQYVTIYEVRIAKGGVWGKTEAGWIALRFNDQNLTDWKI